MDKFSFFLPFAKVEKADDGSRMVTGYASTPTKDLDNEIVSLDAIKAALPSYMEWRNIRQMHQPIAIGTAKEASVDDKGLYVTGKIVDANAIKLLDEEVLKGFSIGGKKISKRGDTITAIELIEISLVDRPANPDCRIDTIKGVMQDIMVYGPEADSTDEVSWLRKMFEKVIMNKDAVAAQTTPINKTTTLTVDYLDDPGDQEYVVLCKREFSSAERDSAAAAGEAMPGGGYPIKSRTDLHNAIQAFGRAKNPDATKKHIIRRARALGATDALPADWEGSTKEKAAFSGAFAAVAAQYPGLLDDVFEVEEKIDYRHEAAAAVIKSIAPSVADRLEKGCGTITDMVCAFGLIRDAQRRLLREAAIEKDGEDEALCQRLGTLAAELAAVIGQKVEHEGSEAQYLTDADDLQFFTWNGDIAMTLNANASELAKRASQAHAAHLAKAQHHLRKAAQSNAAGMKCMKDAAAMHGAFTKAADGAAFDHVKALGHLGKAHGHFGDAADHMEMAHTHMGKAAGGHTEEGGGAEDVTHPGPTANTGGMGTLEQSHLTEGDVPWYESHTPYPGKAAAVPQGYVSKAEVEALVKAATAEATSTALKASNDQLIALLAKMPAGGARPKLFAMPEKATALGADGETVDDGALLFDGINPQQLEDSTGAVKAAGTMVANMMKNKSRFARSVFDPGFNGKAGMGKQ